MKRFFDMGADAVKASKVGGVYIVEVTFKPRLHLSGAHSTLDGAIERVLADLFFSRGVKKIFELLD